MSSAGALLQRALAEAGSGSGRPRPLEAGEPLGVLVRGDLGGQGRLLIGDRGEEVIRAGAVRKVLPVSQTGNGTRRYPAAGAFAGPASYLPGVSPAQ